MVAKPTPQQVADVLRRARERMNESGRHWVRGQLKIKRLNGEYSYCSLGGIYAETKDSALRTAAINALVEANELKVPGGEFFGSIFGSKKRIFRRRAAIVNWNDSDHRRWPEVKKAFQKAEKYVLGDV